MARLDLDGYLDDDAVQVPVKTGKFPDGKMYTIPSPNFKDGLLLSAMANLATRAHLGGDISEADLAALDVSDDQAEELDLYKKVLGTAYDELVADEVSWVRLERLGRYMFVYFAMSEEAAEAMASGNPAALNREQRRATKKSAKKSTRQGSRGSSKARKSESPA